MTRSPSLKLLAHTILLAFETEEYRHPASRKPESGTLEHIVSRARKVEDAGFDGVFFGDSPSLNRALLGTTGTFPYEPFTLLSAIAARTSRLGLIGTIATQYNDPYNLARRFASLEQISGGRSGWNAVTGFLGERNFGFSEIIPPEERYKRAEEFVDVVLALWNSWKPGYADGDTDALQYYDTSKIQDVAHHGQYFDVEEALNIPPSPQGQPVLVQAGGSENGLELAGKYGELIYAAAPTFEQGQAQVATYHAKVQSYGRSKDSIKVVPGLYAYVGATDEEALENRQRTVTDHDLLTYGIGAAQLEYSGFTFEGVDLDQPLTADLLPTREEIDRSSRRRSRANLYLGFAERPGATLRSFLTEIVTAGGHTNIVGSYDSVADELERWYRNDAADGFVLMGTNSLDEFLGEIIPRLERKGIYDASPELTTFRDRLGLPESASAPAAVAV